MLLSLSPAFWPHSPLSLKNSRPPRLTWRAAPADLQEAMSMRVFVASLATETNTFSPLYVDRSAFESAFYCPPGTHPDTPTLCSAPACTPRRHAATCA